MSLAKALQSPDTPDPIVEGTVSQVYADGTADVNLGGGVDATSCVILSAYTPATGDKVQLLRRNLSSWLILGPVRTSNPTTVTVGRSWGIPFNVTPAASAGGTLVVSPVGTASFRTADGWSRSEPYQGAYSSGLGYWMGCYFYGESAFASLAGRTCTGLTIRLIRHTAIGGTGVGSSGANPQFIAPHAHGTQPGAAPYFTAGAQNIGSLSAPTTPVASTFALPASWGQALINGTAKGFGHLSLTTAFYQRCKSVAEDGATGQLSLTWA